MEEFFVQGLFLFIAEAVAAHVDNKIAPVSRLAGKTFRLGEQL
jgi:hypothetical protein